MKTTIISLIAVFSFLMFNAQATTYELTKANSEGFTVTIESVVSNLDNNTHTIVLRIANNGRNSFTCKPLANFAVEAVPGTYSDVNLNVISGAITYDSYTAGPSLGVDPFQGFKYNGFKNIGRDKSGSFSITYTITGDLQNQRVSCNTGTESWIVRFTAKDFENVRDINNNNVITLEKNKEINSEKESNKNISITNLNNLNNNLITAGLETFVSQSVVNKK